MPQPQQAKTKSAKGTANTKDEPTITESLQQNWNFKTLKGLKILIDNNKPFDREKYVICILKHAPEILTWKTNQPGTDVATDTQKVEKKEQEKRNFDKDLTQRIQKLSEIETQGQQFWQKLNGGSNKKYPGELYILKKAEDRIHELENRIAELEKLKQTIKENKKVPEPETELRKCEKSIVDPQQLTLEEEMENNKSVSTEVTRDTQLEHKKQVTEMEEQLSQLKEQKAKDLAEKEDTIKELEEEVKSQKQTIQTREENQKKTEKEKEKLEKQLKDINNVQQELEATKIQLQSCEKEAQKRENSDKEKNDQKYKDELGKVSKELQNTQQGLNKANMKIQELETSKATLTKQIQSQRAGTEVMHLRDQVKLLSERLAAEMNTKVSADESALENISIGNRPMKVAEEYHLFCSNLWLDAKEFLDQNNFEPKDAIDLLQKILMLSEKQSEKVAKKVNNRVLKILLEPMNISKEEGSEEELPTVIPEAAKPVVTAAGDYLRRTADNVELESIVEVVEKEVPKNYKKTGIFKEKAIESYISGAVRLSWKMSIQRPAMTFSVEGENKKWEGEQSQELYWGSKPDRPGAAVKYYVHPKLKHGDKLMVKGRVMVE